MLTVSIVASPEVMLWTTLLHPTNPSSVCALSYSDFCGEIELTQLYDGLGVTMTSRPDLSSIRFSNELRDFTLVVIYDALTVSSLDVGSCSSANCNDTLLSV